MALMSFKPVVRTNKALLNKNTKLIIKSVYLQDNLALVNQV